MKNKKSFYWSLVACLIISVTMLTCNQASALTLNVPGPNIIGQTNLTIQEAIDRSIDGDIILVDDGIYTENINFKGKAITVKSVNGAKHTTIAGTASLYSDRNPDAGGNVVTFNSGETANSVLDGFTITNGGPARRMPWDPVPSEYIYEGGILADSGTSPTITNCIITGNLGSGDNKHNIIGGGGSGIYCINSSPIITECTISENQEHGINSYAASPVIDNCTINTNLMSGIRAATAYDPNQDYYGIESVVTVSTSSINNNGIGLRLYHLKEATFTNCNIYNNDYWIESSGSVTKVINCTINNNPSRCTVAGSILTITNSIMWNSPIDPISLDCLLSEGCWGGYESSIYITYSNIQGSGGHGEGNIDADPLFVDAANSNYHLSPESPCIDAGTSDGAPASDIEGDIRPQGDGVDMGSDEYLRLGTISGFITNASHSPISNALMKLRRNGVTLDETRTSSTGYYKFNVTAPGGYTVVAQAPGYKNNWALGFVNPDKKWRKKEFINLVLTPRSTITTYYVDGSCGENSSADGAGTSVSCTSDNKPFKTIQYAINRATPGDTVKIVPYDYSPSSWSQTVYNTNLVVTKAINLETYTRNIPDEFIPYAGYFVVIDGDENNDQIGDNGNATIAWSGTGGTLQNLTITGGYAAHANVPGVGLFIAGEGTDPAVSNLFISDNENGIIIRMGAKPTITKSWILSNAKSGIAILDGSEPIKGNYIFKNDKGTGVALLTVGQGINVSGNTIEDNYRGIGIRGNGDPSIIITLENNVLDNRADNDISICDAYVEGQ